MRTIKRDIVGVFIFSADNKLLLGHAGVYADKWSVPGGGIEEGETKEQAVIREIREETGIDLSEEMVEFIRDDLTGESEKTLRDTGERVNVQMRFYNYKAVLRQPAAEVGIVAEDDFRDVTWIDVDELKNAPLAEPTVSTLEYMGIRASKETE